MKINYENSHRKSPKPLWFRTFLPRYLNRFALLVAGTGFELTELEAPPIEFDEKLWHAVVDHVTVYNDDRLVYSLKDGTEITVEL